MTTTIDIKQLREAARMLRTPTASWHREAMAIVLEEAAKHGAQKPPRKPRKAKTFEEEQVAKLLKVKFPSRAMTRTQAWPVYLGHDGTIIEDGKVAAAYLKQVAA
jgi:hypothetical protein